MPAFPMRVIKNRWIAVGRRDDQGVWCRRFFQFESKIAERRRGRTVERLGAEIGRHDKRADEQERSDHEERPWDSSPGDTPTSASGKNGRDRDQRKLIPLIAIAVADDENEEQHRAVP